MVTLTQLGILFSPKDVAEIRTLKLFCSCVDKDLFICIISVYFKFQAADIRLSKRDFPGAIALYRLSGCKHLKVVLKFASSGHVHELLSYLVRIQMILMVIKPVYRIPFTSMSDVSQDKFSTIWYKIKHFFFFVQCSLLLK